MLLEQILNLLLERLDVILGMVQGLVFADLIGVLVGIAADVAYRNLCFFTIMRSRGEYSSGGCD